MTRDAERQERNTRKENITIKLKIKSIPTHQKKVSSERESYNKRSRQRVDFTVIHSPQTMCWGLPVCIDCLRTFSFKPQTPGAADIGTAFPFLIPPFRPPLPYLSRTPTPIRVTVVILAATQSAASEIVIPKIKWLDKYPFLVQ